MSGSIPVETARVFDPLLPPARYKGAFGGRGSGKSHFFAQLAVMDALRLPGEIGEGMRFVAIREVQKDLSQSAKLLIEDKIAALGLGEPQGFKTFKDVTQLPRDGLIIYKGMNQYNADSIKSLEGYHRAWVEEAQTFGATSLELLRPTIRVDGSELWFSWNPRRKVDPVDVMFRGPTPPTGAVSVNVNWHQNPFFPEVLEQERVDCWAHDPDGYPHIWMGEYASISKTAYWAKELNQAKSDGRIAFFAADPLMTYRAFFDIGGTGRKSDATSIWIAQFIAGEIRVLDYYEATQMPLASHLVWMRNRGYTEDNTVIWLPHDGSHGEKVFDVSYQSACEDAGYETYVVENMGKGAALNRVDIARRLFPRIRFNADTTAAGRDALGWYHERVDEERGIGRGPDHDWSSHAADAFGLMCVCYEDEPTVAQELPQVDVEYVV